MRLLHALLPIVPVIAALAMMRTTVFDPSVLQKIAQDAIAKNSTVEVLVENVVAAMQRTN